MFRETKEKIQAVIKSSPFLHANGQWSFYRFGIFFFSYKGQMRILSFFGRTIRFFVRKIFGIKTIERELYEAWMLKNLPGQKVMLQYQSQAKKFIYSPKISVLMSVTQTTNGFIHESIQSIIDQIYDNWELCISYEAAIDKATSDALHFFSTQNPGKIKLTGANLSGNQVSHLNTALRVSSGDFITVLRPNDLFSNVALFHVVAVMNDLDKIDLFYSDEDKIDIDGKFIAPHFKPDWCPDSFLSRNYIGNLYVIRKTLVLSAGNFNPDYSNAYEYEILLRISELTNHIYHIDSVLYHNRTPELKAELNIKGEESLMAIQHSLKRRNIEGDVSFAEEEHEVFSIRYKIFNPGKVSVIIPTKNKPDLCEVVLSSIFLLTDYPDFEIVLIDNNSDEPEFFEWVKKWQLKEPIRFKYVKDSGNFNYSRLMNTGASNSAGEYLLLLNNDTEVLNGDWMSAMVEQCQFSENGVVGVKLLYPNDTIQHAGVIVGLGGIANHPFVGYDKYASGYFHHLKAITNYSAVTAACFMVRKNVFFDVGGFEEKLAVEFNDVDFCLKVREKGYKNVYLPHVILYHYESISRGHPHKTRKSYRQHLNDMAFFEKRWKKYIHHDPCYSSNLTRLFTDFSIRVKELP